ncbi:retinoschisin-like [Lingula anatina]|uniref:Retinoschisin-like n=1 Tax=Lingula anatina TaxID=7574 RepID=A0A2R2MJF9_LINAN|nr:retinoschisin-like [Lingula anatina]|eukprot:XP_023930340.1 retinoschisin-like [Lingula anatina]
MKAFCCFPFLFFLTFLACVHFAWSAVPKGYFRNNYREALARGKLYEIRSLNHALLKHIARYCPDEVLSLEANLRLIKRDLTYVMLLRAAMEIYYDLVDLSIKCQAACSHRLVFGSDPIPKKAITASSVYSSGSQYAINLNSTWAWVPAAAQLKNQNQWIQFDLGTIRVITAVLTMGRADRYNNWVTEYKLQYSVSGSTWTTYQDGDGKDKHFSGNSDRNTIVRHDLVPHIQARFVRILPMKWYAYIAMRADILGC